MDQFIYIRSLGVTTSCESWPEEWGCGYWQQKWASSVCAQLSHSGGPHSRQRKSGSSSGWIRGRRFQLKGDRGYLQDNLKHLCLNCSPNNSDLDKWRKTREPNWSTPTQTRCKTTKKTQRSAKRQKLEAKYSKRHTKQPRIEAKRHKQLQTDRRRAGLVINRHAERENTCHRLQTTWLCVSTSLGASFLSRSVGALSWVWSTVADFSLFSSTERKISRKRTQRV